MHNRCFSTCYRRKIWAPLRKLFAPTVSQAGYGPAYHSSQFSAMDVLGGFHRASKYWETL